MGLITSTYGLVVAVLVGIVELINRITVAMVFWNSGMAKYATWSSTQYLFEHEYKVPLIPWEIAAYMGTAAELLLAPLVAFGLISRFSGSALFLVNLVAYISYAHVLQERPIGGLDHQIWGLMLLVVALRGAGLFSLDTLFQKIWSTVEPRKRSWITKGHAIS